MTCVRCPYIFACLVYQHFSQQNKQIVSMEDRCNTIFQTSSIVHICKICDMQKAVNICFVLSLSIKAYTILLQSVMAFSLLSLCACLFPFINKDRPTRYYLYVQIWLYLFIRAPHCYFSEQVSFYLSIKAYLLIAIFLYCLVSIYKRFLIAVAQYIISLSIYKGPIHHCNLCTDLSIYLSIYLSLSLYIYIYIYI